MRRRHKGSTRSAKLKLHVPVDPAEASSADLCRATVRALDPGATDEEIVAGLRELADEIEREMLAAKAVN